LWVITLASLAGTPIASGRGPGLFTPELPTFKKKTEVASFPLPRRDKVLLQPGLTSSFCSSRTLSTTVTIGSGRIFSLFFQTRRFSSATSGARGSRRIFVPLAPFFFGRWGFPDSGSYFLRWCG